MLKSFLNEMAKILETSPDLINERTLMSDHTWDSLAWVETATLLKSNYGVSLSLEDLQQCSSIIDLWDFTKKSSRKKLT